MAKQLVQTTFNAQDLQAFHNAPGNRRNTFVPSLTTGSFPANQASAVSGVINPIVEVTANEVPQPSTTGAPTFNSSGSLPPVAPIQNLGIPPTAQPAPWVKISACNAANFKKSPGLGLISAASGS
jgi:hypothetical protein